MKKMRSQVLSEKIDAFLSGELLPKEAQAFAAEIASDPSLAAEVEAHRLEQAGIAELVRRDLDLDLGRWRENMDELPPPPDDVLPAKPAVRTTAIPRPWLLSGIALLLLVAAAWWFWSQGNPGAAEKPSPPPPAVEKPKTPIAEAPAPAPQPQIAPPPVPQPKKPARQESYGELIALADENMSDLHGSIEKQLSATRGTQLAENGRQYFNEGLDDFLNKQYSAAKVHLLQVLPGMTDYYPYARKMLAQVFYSEKNYRQAALCFEQYAAADASPPAKWRLLHFYLADYGHQQSKFWRELNQLAEGGGGAEFQAKAMKLRDDLKKKGFAEK
ncbi:MAG: hypothetical protein HY842_02685 [Bacteroidetes bacterium]|nr:hypothetical protein [Bacteroidota bacterium]